MEHLFDIPYLLTTYGYPGIFIIVFLESGIFFLLPGDSLLFTAGLMAPLFDLNVFLLTMLTIVAAFTGALAGYYIGTRLELLRRYSFFRKILKQEHIDKAHDFLVKHGLPALIFSRFLPVVRTFLPIVAGIARMDFKKFSLYSLLGAISWSLLFILSGYYLGRAFPEIENYLFEIILLIVFLSFLPGIIHYFKKRA